MKSVKELFEEELSKLDSIATNISDIDMTGFIEYCENFYGMTTINFHTWYENNDYEGNVDKKMWYLFTKNI